MNTPLFEVLEIGNTVFHSAGVVTIPTESIPVEPDTGPEGMTLDQLNELWGALKEHWLALDAQYQTTGDNDAFDARVAISDAALAVAQMAKRMEETEGGL